MFAFLFMFLICFSCLNFGMSLHECASTNFSFPFSPLHDDPILSRSSVLGITAGPPLSYPFYSLFVPSTSMYLLIPAFARHSAKLSSIHPAPSSPSIPPVRLPATHTLAMSHKPRVTRKRVRSSIACCPSHSSENKKERRKGASKQVPANKL